jgi:hypothetical protein
LANQDPGGDEANRKGIASLRDQPAFSSHGSQMNKARWDLKGAVCFGGTCRPEIPVSIVNFLRILIFNIY